jgi:hypothetical protein
MAIKEVEDQIQEGKPILEITLPAPRDGNPKSPLSFGQHNAAAQRNFEKVANLLLSLMKNQQMMSGVIVAQGNEIKRLRKSIKAVSENIGKFIKENNNGGKSNKQ